MEKQELKQRLWQEIQRWKSSQKRQWPRLVWRFIRPCNSRTLGRIKVISQYLFTVSTLYLLGGNKRSIESKNVVTGNGSPALCRWPRNLDSWETLKMSLRRPGYSYLGIASRLSINPLPSAYTLFTAS